MERTRIIVADDESLVRTDLREMLTNLGYLVIGEVGDGRSAVNLARELKPDLVMMDIRMPDMDGIEAARVLTEENVAPVLLLSAYSQPDLVAAREAGVVGYLVKPIREADLPPAIEVVLGRFAEFRTLLQEKDSLQDQLETRKLVDRAKGILMDKQGLTEAEAFRRIQKMSMNNRRPMKEVAEAIVLAHQVGDKLNPALRARLQGCAKEGKLTVKIREVKAYPVWATRRNVLIVKVETDDGFHGWGEAGLSGRELAVQGAVSHYRQFLLGKDPRRIGALWQEMYRSQYFEGGRVLTAAISAIDIALHDVVARSLGVPVYQLLGGAHRERVPCFVTTHAPMGPEAVADVQALVAEGWEAIRVVPGHPDTGGDDLLFEPRASIGVTAEWLPRIREAVGHGPVLGIDYHHRLSVAEAASFCQKLPPGTLDFLEEPIRAESPEAYAQLRQMTPVPLAVGEEFASKWAFLPFIERGLTNFARVDVCNVGGFTEAMKVAGWCEAHYIDLMPHNPLGPISTAAHVHLGAAVPNFAWLEDRSREFTFDDALFPVQLRREGTGYPLPQGPGLGVEFNEEMARHEFAYWEAPHLHRRDGSYTNW